MDKDEELMLQEIKRYGKDGLLMKRTNPLKDLVDVLVKKGKVKQTQAKPINGIKSDIYTEGETRP